MTKKGIAFLLLASVTAFTAHAQHAEFVATAKAQLVRGLKDPASAQFRDLYVSRSSTDGLTLCGEVNAKNSYGGYVGFNRFFSSGGGFVQIESASGPLGASGLTVNAETMAAMWPAVCTRKIAEVQ